MLCYRRQITEATHQMRADEITVFKSLGCALADLVMATLARQNAEQRASV